MEHVTSKKSGEICGVFGPPFDKKQRGRKVLLFTDAGTGMDIFIIFA